MTLINNCEGVAALPKRQLKKLTFVASMLKDNVYGELAIGADPRDNIWVVSRDVYDDTVCDGEWTKLIKTLRIAGDNIHNLRLTNTYVQEKLKECFEEIEDIKKICAVFHAELELLSELDVAFGEAVSRNLSGTESKKDEKIIEFEKLPRKSKSEEDSYPRICTGCYFKEKRESAKYKIYRKKEYGKYCSFCGAVEAFPQRKAVKCCECKGEIVLPRLCSSCDSLDLKTLMKKGTATRKKLIDKACSACNFLKRKRLVLSQCTKCRRVKRVAKALAECGSCSDCEYTSSCDIPRSYPSADTVSTEQEQPLSGHSLSHEYDMSSSTSSSETEVAKACVKRPKSTCFQEPAAERGETVEDEFNTPREGMSAEDVSLLPAEDWSYTTVQGPEEAVSCAESLNWSDEEYQDPVETAPEEKQELPEISLLKNLASEPHVSEICERIYMADEALRGLSSENAKIEQHIWAVQNISEQNLKLSRILREIMAGMTSHLDFIQQLDKSPPPDESEGSEEFQEAVEELEFVESDSDLFYETSVPTEGNQCSECQLKSNNQSTQCSTCQSKFTQAISPPSMDKMKSEPLTVALPIILDRPQLPLPILENKLKVLEKETDALKSNNEFINMFICEMQKKLTAELNRMKSLTEGTTEESSSGSAILGFDLSVYQVKRTVTGKSGKDKIIEEIFPGETQKRRNFVQMKFEEVFKKEQQRAFELEVFHQKLEVEGLIIKEREEFYTCSNCSQLTERVDDFRTLPLSLIKRYASEKFQMVRDENSREDTENEEVVISVEIEVEKEKTNGTKKSLRCDCKASQQMDKELMEYDKKLQALTLCPLWPFHSQSRIAYPESVQEAGVVDEAKNVLRVDREYSTDEMYFLGRDDCVEIKSPDYSYMSSDEESESCAGYCLLENRYKENAVPTVAMPAALSTLIEVATPQTPLAVLYAEDHAHQQRELSRISRMELKETLASRVVLLQMQAVVSAGPIDSPSTMDLQKQLSGVHETHSRTNINISSSKVCRASLVYFSLLDLGKAVMLKIHLPNDEISALLVDTSLAEEFEDCLEVTNARLELSTALNLIREIETDVVEVKLHRAIEILPQLESVLREHIQEKVKVLAKKSSTITNSSLDVFMSTLTFLTDDGEATSQQDSESGERLKKMVNLMTGLEDAVKDIAANEACPGDNAGRIYKLLQALSDKIKDASEDRDVVHMEETLELTSELDLAVREYSSELQSFRTPSMSEMTITPKGSKETDDDCVLVEKLCSMKQKIYDVVEQETREREQRIVKNLDRIARLEEENSEVMKFLDTLLDKTLNRVAELDEVRTSSYNLSELAREIVCFYEIMTRGEFGWRTEAQNLGRENTETGRAVVTEEICGKSAGLPGENLSARQDTWMREETAVYCTAEAETSPPRTPKVARRPTLPSIAEVSSDKASGESSEEERIKNSVSDMMATLEKLKIRAQEKKQKCDEIFGKKAEERKQPSLIQQVERVGTYSYYLAWKRPMDEADTIVGYEIWVNGKVNQRVRNPDRLKAVLCLAGAPVSRKTIDIELFAVMKDTRRRIIGQTSLPWEPSR